MYGTSSESGEDSDVPPTCPACQGKTYYVDPEQTVITCYDCGRYFRRKKPGSEDAPSVPAPPPAVPEPPVAEPMMAEPPAVPEPPVPEPAVVVAPPIPEPPTYAPPPTPVIQPEAEPYQVPEPPMEAAEVVEEEGDFDLMLGDAAEVPEPDHSSHASIEVGETVHCSVCGFPMQQDWKVCPNCVSRYETSCTNCGKTMSAWWLICPWCETPKHTDHIHIGQS